jgi:hypothetical protein
VQQRRGALQFDEARQTAVPVRLAAADAGGGPHEREQIESKLSEQECEFHAAIIAPTGMRPEPDPPIRGELARTRP